MAFLVLTLGLALVTFIWCLSTAGSFMALRRSSRRLYCVVSAFGAFLAANGVLGLTMIDDYNDFPGYTCTKRDPAGPRQIPPGREGARGEWHFGSNIGWSSEVELFPLGLKCTYWTKDEPRIETSTHSPWTYSVFAYAFGAMSLVQIVRLFGPALGGLPSGGSEIERVDFPAQ